MSWRNLTYYAIVLPAFLPLAACVVPGWKGYRARYLDRWRRWLPAMLAVAALMAVLDAFSVAQGWWVFNLGFFTPPSVAGVPLAELLFFVGAVFFIRFVVVAAQWQPWIKGPTGHLLPVTTGALAVASYLAAWTLADYPRAVFEFGFLYPLSTLLLAATPAFRRRETWVAVITALCLLFAMDSVMNSLGTFTHAPGAGTGLLVFGVFPLEDIPYALGVIQLLIAAPHWRHRS